MGGGKRRGPPGAGLSPGTGPAPAAPQTSPQKAPGPLAWACITRSGMRRGRGWMVKYWTNSVWSSWLSQRGWLPTEARALESSLLAGFPWHLGSRNKGVQRSEERRGISNEERGQPAEGQRLCGWAPHSFARKLCFAHFISE